jgi:endo-1,4-beta-xylanase
MNGCMSDQLARIRQHRTADAVLHLKDRDGHAMANTTFTVGQTRHQFLFGCNMFLLDPQDRSTGQDAYRKQFAALLNFATLPFYWGLYEEEAGHPDKERLQAMAMWCHEHHIAVKGHPLCWHTLPPTWYADRSQEEMYQVQMERIHREVEAFRGRIDMWDVVNEAVIMPRFTQHPNHMTPLVQAHGVLPILQEAFTRAREANPRAILLLNDYDHTEAYEQLIEECLNAGVDIDAIGIQSHMHQGYVGNEEIWSICERFARFGKPLHWTEVTLISGDIKPENDFHTPQKDWPSTPEGEARQAEEVVAFYSTLYSHQAVEAITWWDFRDACWLGAPTGLLRRDMSPKPAYERLMELIKGEWWFGQQTLTTDASGTVSLSGPRGTYELTVAGKKCDLILDEGGRCDITVK